VNLLVVHVNMEVTYIALLVHSHVFFMGSAKYLFA
jgi:hypothetical protein